MSDSEVGVYNDIDGKKWDLTVSQFEEPIPYDDTASTREAAMADTSREKYVLLTSRLRTAMVAPRSDV